MKLLMDKKQAAEALGVSLRTINRLLSEKKLPHVKVRHSVRIPIDAVLGLASSAQ
jgi:excisionase family DNA binding protein